MTVFILAPLLFILFTSPSSINFEFVMKDLLPVALVCILAGVICCAAILHLRRDSQPKRPGVPGEV
jgi:ABC-type polysaccharide/polyol phosphate export permease